MRKLVLLAALLLLGTSLALAQGKIDNGWHCAKATSQNAIDVGDKPGHAYSIDQIKCTSTKGEFAGVREKEGTGTEFMEVSGNDASGHGIFVETMANGDKMNFTYQMSATMDKGMLKSATDKFQATSGTGKFKGVKASGSCTGKGNADGSTDWACTGTYTIPK